MAKNKAKMNKFLTGAITATMVATAVAPVAAIAAEESKFTDISGYDQATQDKINALAAQGIVNGTSDTTFAPSTAIKRGQVVKLLGRYLVESGLAEVPADWETKERFKDVPVNFTDQDLVKNAAIVFDAEVFQGSNGQLNSSGEISRQNMALVLNRAAEAITGKSFADLAEGKDSNVADLDDAKTEAQGAIEALNALGISTVENFKPLNNVSRANFATFLFNAIEVIEDVEDEIVAPEVVSVSAINDTTIEVTFGKALDKDVAREIEDDKERFAIYDGGETANTAGIIKSEFISFNDDYTVATVDLTRTPETDINYTVALMSGNNNTTADVMYESKQVILKAGAEQPTLEVNADQDKFVLDFKVKMDSGLVEDGAFVLEDVSNADAFDADKKMIAVYDNNDKFVADIQDLAVADTVKWEDSTTRKAIEFKIEPGKLQAGKTYKVKVGKGVETDDGDVLSDSKRTIKVTTPTIDKARPVAKFARVTGEKTIEVVFDKDLKAETTVNSALIDVTTATNKDIDVESAVVEADGKVLTITLKDAEALKENQSYKVNLKENTVANNVFQNALNKATTGIKAEAQANDPIKKMSAKFERQHDNKDKADLLLTFDQRVDIEETDFTDGLTIEEGGKTYVFEAGEVEYDVNDATGKTVRIKDITAADAFDKAFKLESGKSYKVKVARGTVATDSMATDKATNTVELTSTISGLDVTAPVVDNVTFESESKMVVEFDKPINSKVSASDVYVLGYKLNRSGDFSDLVALNDENHIKVSASGSKLTITAKDNDIKFVTGAIDASDVALGTIAADSEQAFFALKADKIKGTNDVEAKAQFLTFENQEDSGDVKLTVAGDDKGTIDVYDNAAPVMIGAAVTDADTLQITYSENVNFKGEDNNGRQYTFDGLETKNYGTPLATTGDDDNLVVITFEKDEVQVTDSSILEPKAYSNLKITYKNNSTYQLQDTLNKAAKNQSITGAKKAN